MLQVTALYIRLSQEDDNIGESNSITNQRDLLNEFVSKHPELMTSKLLYFVDDGYSGANFNRPAVVDMLRQIRKGLINCVIVKDFSRFGRNYIEVGGYLEQVFPFLAVRFISVNDSYDSNGSNNSSVGITVGFKTLMHDLYSKDLGVKSKSGKIAKAKKGEHTAGHAPFGYVKSKTVKNAWDVDEVAATTIRKVYSLALDSKTITEIARILNAEGVSSPLMHRKENNRMRGVIDGSHTGVSLWKRENISKILRDERYTGKLVTGKLVSSNYSAIKHKLQPKSEWLIVPDAHEAIIAQSDYDTVQRMLKPTGLRKGKSTNFTLLAGKLFCRCCSHALRRYDKPYRYVCRSSIELGKKHCLPDHILESHIFEVILETLQVELALAHTEKKQAEKHSKVLIGEQVRLSNEIARLTKEIERLKNSRESLFEEYADGKLTKEEYIAVKLKKTESIAKAEKERINLELSRSGQPDQQCTRYDTLIPFAEAKKVTAEMVALIKRITVFADNRFEIEFTFSRLGIAIENVTEPCIK